MNKSGIKFAPLRIFYDFRQRLYSRPTMQCYGLTQSRYVPSPIEVVLSNDEVRLKAHVRWSMDGHIVTRPESNGSPERLSPFWPYSCSSKAHVAAIQGHSCWPAGVRHKGRPVGASRCQSLRKSKGRLAEVSLARTADNWRSRSGNDTWKRMIMVK